MTPAELFSAGRFQDLAELIDASGYDPKTARILTVCNPEPTPFDGTVVFPVVMRWRSDSSLPPVCIFDPFTLIAIPVRIVDLLRNDDRIAFDLLFNAQSVPAQGYKVFVAEYAEIPSPLLIDPAEPSNCVVIETLPHPGSLPWMMSFC